MKGLITNCVDALIAIILAGIGGLIRVLANHKHGEKSPSFGRVFIEILIAGFSGLLVETLLHKWNVDSDTKIVVVAISGYAAREVIEVMCFFSASILGTFVKKVEDANKKNDNNEGGSN